MRVMALLITAVATEARAKAVTMVAVRVAVLATMALRAILLFCHKYFCH